MRTSTRAKRTALRASLVTACASGCSLASGWDDLRGGKRAPPPGGDAAVIATAPDASDESDAGGTDGAVTTGLCTATSCAPQLCCRAFVGGVTGCAASCGVGAVELRCNGSHECAGSTCCIVETPGDHMIAACTTSMCPPLFEVCDPAVGCPSPKKCSPGTFGVHSCQ